MATAKAKRKTVVRRPPVQSAGTAVAVKEPPAIRRADIPRLAFDLYGWQQRITVYLDSPTEAATYRRKGGFSAQTPGGARLIGNFEVMEIGALHHTPENENDQQPDKRIVLITPITPK